MTDTEKDQLMQQMMDQIRKWREAYFAQQIVVSRLTAENTKLKGIIQKNQNAIKDTKNDSEGN